ncbi:hypothetical protein MMA231_04180 (plasmid) [Asticcacaulis sp. MM231]
MPSEKTPIVKADATGKTDAKKGSAKETLDRFREKIKDIPAKDTDPKSES